MTAPELFRLDDEARVVAGPRLPGNRPGARPVDDRWMISGVSGMLRPGSVERCRKPAIPRRRNGARRVSLDARICRACWRGEAATDRLEAFHRVATSHDKLAANRHPAVALASAAAFAL